MFGRRRDRNPGPVDSSGTPLTNEAVVEAMRNVSVADRPEARALLFQLLLETRLFVVTPSAPERTGEHTLVTDESFELVTMSDDEGVVLPVFTSIETLTRWLTEPAGYIALPAATLFEMAAAGGTNKIALDPGSPTWGLVTRYEIEQLARRRLPLGEAGNVVSQQTEMRIGRPATPPSTAVLDALRTQLVQAPAAVCAWFFLMQQGDLTPEMCIAIQFDDGVDANDGLMRRIIDGAGAATEDVRALSFLVADESWRTSLADGSGEQFYQRA